MAFLNRCIWTATSAGTGDFVVSAAARGGYKPSDCANPSVVNGAPYHYWAVDPNDSTIVEEGDGTFNTSTGTLTRVPNRNTLTGSKISFSSPPVVYMGGPVATDLSQPYSRIFYAEATDASVRACAAAADAVAGGIVKLAGGVTMTTAPLPIYNGVVYEGVPMWGPLTSGSAPLGGSILRPTVGTILSGTYNSTTGVIVLTMSAAPAYGAGVGVALYSLTGTGAFANLNTATYALFFGGPETNWLTTSVVGSTVTIQGPTGLGAATITGGSLTFDGFEFNNADLSTPPANTSAFTTAMVTGAGVRECTLDGFAYGVKIGGLYNPGMTNSNDFEDLYTINCQLWGAWFENYNNCTVENVGAVNCVVGGIARVGSGTTAIYNGGNSAWIRCGATSNTSLARGMVHWTRGGSNTTQEIEFNEIVTKNSFATVTQAATMANGSANITVTDATKFPLDMPVTVSASVNGFIANQIYFVKSVNKTTNVVTLSSTMRGTAVTATGNTAVNLLAKGFALKEIAGLSSSDNFIGIKSYGLDLEGTATMHLLLQNIVENYTIETAIIGGDVYQNSVFRTATRGTYIDFMAGTIDVDQSSVVYQISYDGTNLNYALGNYSGGSVSPSSFNGVSYNTSGNFNYNIYSSGRWSFGQPLVIGSSVPSTSSTNDALTVRKPFDNNYGYQSITAVAADGNAALAIAQGSSSGSSSNGWMVLGIVGTNSDSSYGMNTSSTGLSSGDIVLQTWFGSFQPIFHCPVGTTTFQFHGPAKLANYTVATLPTASIGMTVYVTDGAAALAWGATISGGGSTKYLVWYNGSNWTVVGK